MNNVRDCIICAKHKNLAASTGDVIAESGGVILTHFPQLGDELAPQGRLILEPRRHVVHFEDINDEEAAALGSLCRQGARLLKTVLGAEHVYMYRINDLVAHFHVHLIPRYPGTPKDFWGLKITDWPATPKISLPQIKDLVARLKAGLPDSAV